MQVREIREWTTEEIRRRLLDAYREWFNLRQEWHLGRLEDHNRIPAVRRDIARMQTILRERELAEALKGGAR